MFQANFFSKKNIKKRKKKNEPQIAQSIFSIKITAKKKKKRKRGLMDHYKIKLSLVTLQYAKKIFKVHSSFFSLPIYLGS